MPEYDYQCGNVTDDCHVGSDGGNHGKQSLRLDGEYGYGKMLMTVIDNCSCLGRGFYISRVILASAVWVMVVRTVLMMVVAVMAVMTMVKMRMTMIDDGDDGFSDDGGIGKLLV